MEIIPPCSACQKRPPAFTLIELLAVIAILMVLLALLFPVLGRVQDHMADTKNISRMKTVATALLTGAADNSGYIPSRSNTRGRWPTACHQYFGIRTDLDATKWGEAGQINPIAYTAEVMRPVKLDPMRNEMLNGARSTGPVGIWLVNNHLIARGSSAPGIPGKPLVSVVAPSKTPLVSMSSEDNGLGTLGDKIHPSALEQGFEGETHHGNPAPLRKDRMLYAMCDGSVQVIPDFWPYREPEPWRFFHPLGQDAPASDAP